MHDDKHVISFFEASVLYLLGQPMPELPPLPGRVHRQPDGDGRDRLAERWAALEMRTTPTGYAPGWRGWRP